MQPIESPRDLFSTKMAAPPVGGSIAGAGKALDFAGQTIVVVDEIIEEGEISDDTKVEVGFESSLVAVQLLCRICQNAPFPPPIFPTSPIHHVIRTPTETSIKSLARPRSLCSTSNSPGGTRPQ